MQPGRRPGALRHQGLPHQTGVAGRIVRRHGDAKALLTDILIGDFFKEDIDELWPLLEEQAAAESTTAAVAADSAD